LRIAAGRHSIMLATRAGSSSCEVLAARSWAVRGGL
jgi:hypothetical protein